MQRLGWLVQYRLHGVKIDGPKSANVRVKTRFDDHCNYFVEIAEQPRFRVFHTKPPLRTFPKDEPIRINIDNRWPPDPNEDGYRARYVWLTAIADALFPISVDLQRLSNDAYQAFMSSIRTRVPTSRWDALLNDARLIAAIAAAEHQAIVIEHWGECEVACPDVGENAYRLHLRVEMQMLDDVHVDGDALQQQMLKYMSRLADVRLNDPEAAGRLSIAGQALIRARQERFDSLERFLGVFRAIEVLATLDAQDNVDVAARFDALHALIPEHNSDLADFVDRLKQNYRPPLATRFANLARTYSPCTVDPDVESFRKGAKLRNQIMHGKVSGTAWDVDAIHVRSNLEQLANRYLHLVLAQRAAT